MRFLFVAGLLLAASPAHAGDVMGLPELALMQCAGIPEASMQMSGATIYQYSSMSERGTAIPFGNTLLFRRRAVGCEATVTVKDGIVVDVQLKKSGGLLTRLLACDRLFANCP